MVFPSSIYILQLLGSKAGILYLKHAINHLINQLNNQLKNQAGELLIKQPINTSTISL